MKNVSTKIAYMVIGSLLTIIGYHFGNVDKNTVEAEQADLVPDTDAVKYFEKIVCKEFVIVNEDVKRVVNIAPDLDGAGSIITYDKDGKPLAHIGSDNNGGRLAIWHKGFVNNPIPIVRIGTTAEGDGFVITRDAHDRQTDVMPETNKDLQYYVVTRDNGNGPGGHPKPDKILRVGDKLPSFNDKAIDLAFFISTYTDKSTHVMEFKKGSEIKLKDGTHYICANPDGCKIINFVITTGSIEVYYNK